jgi:hypothetical protein
MWNNEPDHHAHEDGPPLTRAERIAELIEDTPKFISAISDAWSGETGIGNDDIVRLLAESAVAGKRGDIQAISLSHVKIHKWLIGVSERYTEEE